MRVQCEGALVLCVPPGPSPTPRGSSHVWRIPRPESGLPVGPQMDPFVCGRVCPCNYWYWQVTLAYTVIHPPHPPPPSCSVTDSLHIKSTGLTLTADVPALTEQCTHTHTHICTYSYIYMYSFMKFLLSTPLTKHVDNAGSFMPSNNLLLTTPYMCSQV